MQLSTPVVIPSYANKFSYQQPLVLLGSCFAEHIGEKLADHKFTICQNPTGICYNPATIVQSLMRVLRQQHFSEDELFEAGGKWHSYAHHGRFSQADAPSTLATINGELAEAYCHLQKASHLILSLGTAWVFEEIESGKIVNNCHKQPASLFRRYRLSTEQMVQELEAVLKLLWELNPSVEVVFTVSPVRHLKDGAHHNQLSKASLLLAVDCLRKQHPQIQYFPSYELVLDELRDYRYYAKDMAHINELGIEYIWEKLTHSLIEPHLIKEAFPRIQKVRTALQHRPFNAEADEYQQFLQKLLQQIAALEQQYPTTDWSHERILISSKKNSK